MSARDLESLYENPTFKGLVNSVEASNARFRDLPREQKYLAASMIMSGKVDMIPNLWRLVYRRPIPPVSEFLSSEYIGDNALFYPRQEGEVGYVWRKEIEEVFAPNSATYLLVAAGAIGIAKSSACNVMHFYNHYRVTSLLRPQLTMGSAPQKPMNLQLMSVTREKSADTLILPMLNLIRSCKYYHEVKSTSEFMEVLHESEGQIVPFVHAGDRILFPDNIKIVSGSRDYHAIGEDLYGASLDEAEKRLVAKGTEETIALFYEMVERIRSRFMNSRYIFATLISSMGEENGIMAKMIRNIRPDDPYRRVAKFAIWDVRFPREMAKGHFYVLRGTRSFPSRILTDEEYALQESGKFVVPTGCRVIKVPITYKFEFEVNVNRNLRNIAGVETSAEDYPFGRIESCVDPDLTPETVLELNIGEKRSILDMLPREMFLFTPDGPRLRRFPYAKRYIHIDLAISGIAGITCVHKERSLDNDILYVVDFSMRIVTSSHIPYENVNIFIQDLKRRAGVSIHTLTSDTFQSESLQQFVKLRQLSTICKYLSVDRTLNAYSGLLEVVNETCLRIGPCPLLVEELKTVYFSEDKPFSDGRKDQSDSLAGAVYNAILNPQDIPVHTYYSGIVASNSIIPDDFVAIH